MKFRAFALAALLAPAAVSPGAAQVLQFDPALVAAVCAAGDCAAAVGGVLSRLGAAGLTEAEVNTQLGALAATLIDTARTAPAGQAADYAGALRAVAAHSTDPGQAAQILLAAAEVASGGAGGIDVTAPVAASPA